jgi:hypothetical protein
MEKEKLSSVRQKIIKKGIVGNSDICKYIAGDIVKRGELFICTWNQCIKGMLANALKGNQEFQAYCIADERDHKSLKVCSVALIRTREKLNYDEFQSLLKEHLLPSAGAVSRCKSMMKSVRYITTKDKETVLVGFDTEYACVTWRAWQYAKTTKRINWTDSVPQGTCTHDKKLFKDTFNSYHIQFALNF